MKGICCLILKWGMLSLIGFSGGIILESIHNFILLSADWDTVPLPVCSRIVIGTFRSCHKVRLPTGWGSSLTSLFTIMNLLFFLFCCLIVLKGRDLFSTRQKLAGLWDWCFIGNLLLFFLLLSCLVTPLVPSQGAMGIREGETISGATTIGNLLCFVESMFPVILLGGVIMLLLNCRLKKRHEIKD